MGEAASCQNALIQERVMGLEPTISCLGSKRSTTELHPRSGGHYNAHWAIVTRVCKTGSTTLHFLGGPSLSHILLDRLSGVDLVLEPGSVNHGLKIF